MKAGTNVVKLTIPGGNAMNGIIYDYLRLELDEAELPTLFIVGDSTVKNGTKGQQGWGDPIAALFDKTKIKVENHAIGGRSSRTFQTEGRWDKILAAAKPGDFVLMQMGHNDGGPLDDAARARGSIRGTGEETKEIDNPITKKKEVVHTYGWYLRKYVADARDKEHDADHRARRSRTARRSRSRRATWRRAITSTGRRRWRRPRRRRSST